MSELREKAIEEVLAKVRGYDRADIEAALRHCEPMDSEVVCCVEAVEGRLLAEQQRNQARELLRWRDCEVEPAPTDGSHINVIDMHPDTIGFGYFYGVKVLWQAVVHYWAADGVFCLSSGDNADMRPFTHWRPLAPPAADAQES